MDAIGPAQELLQLCPPILKPLAAKVHAIQRQEVKAVQKRAGIMLARMQALEIGNAILTANDRLAVDRESAAHHPPSPTAGQLGPRRGARAGQFVAGRPSPRQMPSL
jgi:hypothetical protein